MPGSDVTIGRFFIASGIALVVDFAVTFALHAGAGLSLALSAAIAFIVTGVAFYFVHEFWTFRRHGSSTSIRRLVQNLTALGLAFTGRVGTIGLLEFLHAPGLVLATVYFGAGAGVSFLINYLVNRHWVFALPKPSER